MIKEIRPNLLAQDSGGEVVSFQCGQQNITTPAGPTRARVFRINRTTNSDGWIRACENCGQHFVLNFVAATIRDGRERICVNCLLSKIREMR